MSSLRLHSTSAFKKGVNPVIRSNSTESGSTSMTKPRQAKKLVIKNLKAKPEVPSDYGEQMWKKLQEAVVAIYENQPISYTLEELYQAVEILCSYNMAPTLYGRLCSMCQEHVATLVPFIQKQCDGELQFLHVVQLLWQTYCQQMTSFSMSCNDVLPEGIALKTDIWSFGTMLVRFFVGSRGPHSQREMATLLLADCLQSPTAAVRPYRVTKYPSESLAVKPDELKALQKFALLEKYFLLATELHRLVQACLTINVDERPTVEQVMEKAFFRSIRKARNTQPVPPTSTGESQQGVDEHLPKPQHVSFTPAAEGQQGDDKASVATLAHSNEGKSNCPV